MLSAELAEVKEKYYQLIYAVAQKFPGETRHETALRYIMERENQATMVRQRKAPVVLLETWWKYGRIIDLPLVIFVFWAALHWGWFVGGFGWFLLLGLSPGAWGKKLF